MFSVLQAPAAFSLTPLVSAQSNDSEDLCSSSAIAATFSPSLKYLGTEMRRVTEQTLQLLNGRTA